MASGAPAGAGAAVDASPSSPRSDHTRTATESRTTRPRAGPPRPAASSSAAPSTGEKPCRLSTHERAGRRSSRGGRPSTHRCGCGTGPTPAVISNDASWPGTAAPGLAQPRPEVEVPALRLLLERPASRRVEHLVGAVRNRQHQARARRAAGHRAAVRRACAAAGVRRSRRAAASSSTTRSPSQPRFSTTQAVVQPRRPGQRPARARLAQAADNDSAGRPG